MVKLKNLFVCFFSFCFLISTSQEICNNGIDDDGDGKIDLYDPDCASFNFSFIENPSFEKIMGCPDKWSQLQLANNWFQHHATAGSTDLYHKCGDCNYKLLGIVSQIPLPVPHGDGFAGFYDVKDYDQFGSYKESLTTCLIQKLKQNETYVLEFYVGFLNLSDAAVSLSPVNISFFGHPVCSALQYGHFSASAYRGCPISTDPEWKELKKVSVSGAAGEWVKVKTEFVAPAGIEGLVIGPSCEPSENAGKNYYLIDNILLYKKAQYSIPFITRSGDICADTLTLKADIAPSPSSFNCQWYKNKIALPGETKPELKITRNLYGEGEYSVSFTINNLSYLSPEEVIKINDLPFFWEDSVALCGNQPVFLKPEFIAETTCSISYLWQDGSTTPTLTASGPGLYWFETNKNGCRRRDSIYIFSHSIPFIDIGADTVLCSGQSLLLSAGNPGLNYQWQDNSQAESFLVTKSGTYSVNVFDKHCSFADTIIITYEKPPDILFYKDTVICPGEEKLLNPEVHGNIFLWNTGNNTQDITVTQAGYYELQVKNYCGSVTKSVNIVKGHCQFYLPSAFTPNNDGLNDNFGLVTSNFIKKYEFFVFNRWGEVIFKTTDPLKKWNGSLGGKLAPAGLYVWTANYSDWLGQKHLKQGTVALIR